jgi:hypothetical protein
MDQTEFKLNLPRSINSWVNLLNQLNLTDLIFFLLKLKLI